MKCGREDAADVPEATIHGEQSAAAAAAAVAAAESAVAATACSAATIVPPPAAIPVVELPVRERVHEKVGEDLDEEKARLHERIEEEFYGGGGGGRGRDSEDDDDVGYDMESRHNKSRYIMRQVIAGKIKYRFYGKLGCPFCGKAIKGGKDGLMEHAVTTGNSNSRKQKASTLAKHAAYGCFLKIVKLNEPYYILPRRR
ncbi:hypothetical protein VPH35_085144 [Triticum aestivum]